MASASIILSACYTIWLWSRIVGGSWSAYLTYTVDITRREYIVIVPLLILTFILGIWPGIIQNDLHPIVTQLLVDSLKGRAQLEGEAIFVANKKRVNLLWVRIPPLPVA